MTASNDVIVKAWAKSEELVSDLIGPERNSWRKLCTSIDTQRNPNVEYYKQLHEKDENYKSNNWLLDKIDIIVSTHPKTVVELGAGNCLFSNEISPHVDTVIAMDFVRPNGDLQPNVRFIEGDLVGAAIPPADMVCSADFLEHVSPDHLPSLIKAATRASGSQFHIIACYDDGHSHLTVMPPGAWLALFRSCSSDYTLSFLECRRNDPRQIVCTIRR